MRYTILTILTFTTILFSSCSKTIGTTKRDVILPIFKGELLITKNDRKWGVIDKNGNEIIPFICDGVQALSDSLGIASVYTSSYSLHTGVPRYVYCGKYFLFTKKGKKKGEEKTFMIVFEGIADDHEEKFILASPNRYVPSDTLSTNFYNGLQFLKKKK